MSKQVVKLEPHQLKAVKKIVAHCQEQKGLLLYHHMGTGKTVTALSVVANFPSHKILFLIPKEIKYVWETNIKKPFAPIISLCCKRKK